MSFRPMTTARPVPRLWAHIARGAVMAALALMMWPALGASAATTLNVTGTYSSVYHCKTGWCAGQDFPATTVPISMQKTKQHRQETLQRPADISTHQEGAISSCH